MKKDSLGAKDFRLALGSGSGSIVTIPFPISGFPGFLSIVQQRSTVNDQQRPTTANARRPVSKPERLLCRATGTGAVPCRAVFFYRDTRHETRDMKCEMRNAKCELKKHENQGIKESKNSKSRIKNPKNPRTQKPKIQEPKNPKIQNPEPKNPEPKNPEPKNPESRSITM